MNIDTVKVELIDWIAQLHDQRAINKVIELKKKLSSKMDTEHRTFGSGKHLIEFIAEDFNEPIDLFNDYRK